MLTLNGIIRRVPPFTGFTRGFYTPEQHHKSSAKHIFLIFGGLFTILLLFSLIKSDKPMHPNDEQKLFLQMAVTFFDEVSVVAGYFGLSSLAAVAFGQVAFICSLFLSALILVACLPAAEIRRRRKTQREKLHLDFIAGLEKSNDPATGNALDNVALFAVYQKSEDPISTKIIEAALKKAFQVADQV
ncbi:unnamed protein product [Arabis nemorensis]|uniref:Uncharacterized protein n=1 Tax=Arabis nemorensis TaxID=586526 RepID=A0A565ALU2_9BRAS|nr:unnamed protein product [Arabis nemorensis]